MNEMEDSDPSLSMKRVFLDPILSHAIPLLDFAKTDTLESVIKNLCEKRWQWGGVFVDDQMSDFRIMNPRILLQMVRFSFFPTHLLIIRTKMLKFNYELVMGWLQQFSVSDLPPSKDQRWHASWQLLHESNSAMTGFKKLDAHQGTYLYVSILVFLSDPITAVNACAIVDKNSRLSANLSVSDFPGLQKNQSQYPSSTFSGYSVEKLKFQVLMYIQAMYDGVIPTPVTCHADTKLGNLCQHMLNEHHHQGNETFCLKRDFKFSQFGWSTTMNARLVLCNFGTFCTCFD